MLPLAGYYSLKHVVLTADPLSIQCVDDKHTRSHCSSERGTRRSQFLGLHMVKLSPLSYINCYSLRPVRRAKLSGYTSLRWCGTSSKNVLTRDFQTAMTSLEWIQGQHERYYTDI